MRPWPWDSPAVWNLTMGAGQAEFAARDERHILVESVVWVKATTTY